MSMSNAYVLYKALAEEHTPGRKILTMKAAIQEATHAFCQRGPPVRQRKAVHPAWVRDISLVFHPGMRKIRTDVKMVVARMKVPSFAVLTATRLVAPAQLPAATQPMARARPVAAVNKEECLLKYRQRKSPWRTHQSIASPKRGFCSYSCCPGATTGIGSKKRNRSHKTNMRCEECSAKEGKDVFFCNVTKNGVPTLCHIEHHCLNHIKKYEDDDMAI